jgi:hypothetical protein
MRIALLLFHLSFVPLLAAETAIQVGDTTITVPTPSGFTPVTKDMATLDRFLETFVTPDNVRFISFIPEELLPAVQSGQFPQMPRTLSLQTNKKVVTRTMTTSNFKELKATLRKQNIEMVKEIEKKMPGLMESVNKKVEGQFNAKLDMNINGIVPLPPHEEGERSMASSALLNFTMTTPDGQKTNYHGVVTTTFLHARGKLFFTYVNGGENDLSWSRQVAKDWTTAILAANPSDQATIAKESMRSGGFDWGRILRNTVIGGLIGGAFGLIRYLFRRTSTK